MSDLLRAVRSGDLELIKKQCARPVSSCQSLCSSSVLIVCLAVCSPILATQLALEKRTIGNQCQNSKSKKTYFKDKNND